LGRIPSCGTRGRDACLGCIYLRGYRMFEGEMGIGSTALAPVGEGCTVRVSSPAQRGVMHAPALSGRQRCRASPRSTKTALALNKLRLGAEEYCACSQPRSGEALSPARQGSVAETVIWGWQKAAAKGSRPRPGHTFEPLKTRVLGADVTRLIEIP
jgi:hypothetical protein